MRHAHLQRQHHKRRARLDARLNVNQAEGRRQAAQQVLECCPHSSLATGGAAATPAGRGRAGLGAAAATGATQVLRRWNLEG